MVARASHQIFVDQLDVTVIRLGDSLLQVEDVNLFDGGSDAQRVCQRLRSFINELVVQLLERRVGEDANVRTCCRVLQVIPVKQCF